MLGAVPASAGAVEGDVCRIDTTGYTTLTAALTAVTEGKTIVLLTDIAYDSPIISNTRSFSVDLAGYDLSIASAQVYCLAATGGKQLSLLNTSAAESSLTITQTIAAADLASASGFGAVYTSGQNSRIEIAANIDTTVTTNMIGADADSGNSIQIGKGTIRADRVGINVTGTGSVQFTGDVYGLGSGADGISCRYSGNVQVNGAVYSDGIGVDAQSSSHVVVTNGVQAYDAHGSIGVYANESAVVQITGNVSAPTRGVFAEGGSITVDGNVSGTGADSIGVHTRDTISPAAQGTVTVTGSVSGKRYGAYAVEGGTVIVDKDAYSTAGTTSYASAAVYSRGVGSTAIVLGNATASGLNSSGIEVNAGGTAEVRGNITATEASSYGVKALSGTYYEVLYGSTATVDGTITATKYILIGATEKASDAWDEVTINGYLSFSGAYPLCYVFVKLPALQAAVPSASPVGGAVLSGTSVTLTTATSGAEIHYTLDGAAPTDSSPLYTAPITVTAPVTVKAIALKSGMTASGVMTESYTILSAAGIPAASPAGGAVPAGTTVTLTTSTPGAKIRYTLDGSNPSASSTLYYGPISITAGLTIKAVAMLSGVPDSAVMTASYTILAAPGTTGTGVLNDAAVYQISASAGIGGTVAPTGKQTVAAYGIAVYSIQPNPGYSISDVLVDGVSVGKVTEYRFSSIRANHTIEARFIHDCPSKAYTDLDIAMWYHEGIDFVLSKGLFVGTSAELFEPEAPMTRAMAVTILYRLAGRPPVSGSSAFSDVPADSWHAAAVTWGAETAAIAGYGNGKFGPGDQITREQFAVILFRYAGNAGRDLAADTLPALDAYQDAEDVSPYALAAVKWACGLGLLEGDRTRHLNPQAELSRAEAAALLMRFCSKAA